MIEAVVAFFLAQPIDGERLAGTAPSYLDADAARAHYAAARLAGMLHDVDPELLLAVAWHESRYDPSVETAEPGGRVSCGVMTPEPKARCTWWDHTLFGGYERGAAHLAAWRRVFHEPVATLWEYAGGGATVRACLDGSESRPCRFAAEMLRRARWIRTRWKLA